MKAKITQEGMTRDKWCIIEYKEDGKTVHKVRCPFDSEVAALKRAQEIAEHYYHETFERVE